MKRYFQHIVLIICLLFAIPNFAQKKDVKGYRIDGDEIVFTFDKEDYKNATHDEYGVLKDFEDLDIENVVVSGNFNNWSRRSWKMKKIDECHYELRKNIEDFTDDFMWEFKFLINHTYWAEPNENIANTTPATNEFGGYYNSSNLKFYTAVPKENGNTKFHLKGFQNAKEVVLSGSFTRWDEEYLQMKPTEDGWEISLDLQPGAYQYKFIVDGNWMEDPDNKKKTLNEFGGYNSVVEVKKWVTFKLEGYLNAEEVILTGSFNNWNENSYQMQKSENGWKIQLYLAGGKHHYKYIIDGDWTIDPENPILEYDGRGNINCVKMVK